VQFFLGVNPVYLYQGGYADGELRASGYPCDLGGHKDIVPSAPRALHFLHKQVYEASVQYHQPPLPARRKHSSDRRRAIAMAVRSLEVGNHVFYAGRCHATGASVEGRKSDDCIN